MQKQRDIVREAISLFQQVQTRRAQLQTEIDGIDGALAQIRGAPPLAPSPPTSVKQAGRRGRGGNPMPLREALVKVLSQGSKTKHELLESVQKIGYRFAASDPMNSLQAFLYGSGKKLLKRVDGRFSLAGGASLSNGSAKPAKKRRTMSPQARKKISEAVKARWAKQKAAKK